MITVLNLLNTWREFPLFALFQFNLLSLPLLKPLNVEPALYSVADLPAWMDLVSQIIFGGFFDHQLLFVLSTFYRFLFKVLNVYYLALLLIQEVVNALASSNFLKDIVWVYYFTTFHLVLMNEDLSLDLDCHRFLFRNIGILLLFQWQVLIIWSRRVRIVFIYWLYYLKGTIASFFLRNWDNGRDFPTFAWFGNIDQLDYVPRVWHHSLWWLWAPLKPLDLWILYARIVVGWGGRGKHWCV